MPPTFFLLSCGKILVLLELSPPDPTVSRQNIESPRLTGKILQGKELRGEFLSPAFSVSLLAASAPRARLVLPVNTDISILTRLKGNRVRGPEENLLWGEWVRRVPSVFA